MMIERSSIFAVMATMMCISAGTHAAKVSDSLLRGHRRIDEDDCLSISKYNALFSAFDID
jgi:hypothetical protein